MSRTPFDKLRTGFETLRPSTSLRTSSSGIQLISAFLRRANPVSKGAEM